MNLRPRIEQIEEDRDEDPTSCLLFRLVDVAARTLEATSCSEGHLARRYVPLLRKMTGIVITGNAQTERMNCDGGASVMDANNIPEQLHSNLEEGLWEMWQQAGLDPIGWPSMFDDINDG